MTREAPRPDPPIPRLTAVTVPEAPAVDERRQADGRAGAGRGAAPAPARPPGGRAVVAGVLVAASSAVVALLGGFQRRTDLLTPVAVGPVITTGPYEVTLAPGHGAAPHRRRTSGTSSPPAPRGPRAPRASTRPTGRLGLPLRPRTPPAARSQVEPARSRWATRRASSSQDTLTPGPAAGAVDGDVPLHGATRATRCSWPSSTRSTRRPTSSATRRAGDATNKASTMTLPLEQLPDTKY